MIKIMKNNIRDNAPFLHVQKVISNLQVIANKVKVNTKLAILHAISYENLQITPAKKLSQMDTSSSFQLLFTGMWVIYIADIIKEV